MGGVRLRHVRFTSSAWGEAGLVRDLRIAAIVAVPQGGGPQQPLAVLISAHGLGGQADA